MHNDQANKIVYSYIGFEKSSTSNLMKPIKKPINMSLRCKWYSFRWNKKNHCGQERGCGGVGGGGLYFLYMKATKKSRSNIQKNQRPGIKKCNLKSAIKRGDIFYIITIIRFPSRPLLSNK